MKTYSRFGDFYDFGTPHSRDSSRQRFKISKVKFLNKRYQCSQRYSMRKSKFYRMRMGINQLKSYYKAIFDLRKLFWMGYPRNSRNRYSVGLRILRNMWILQTQGPNRKRSGEINLSSITN